MPGMLIRSKISSTLAMWSTTSSLSIPWVCLPKFVCGPALILVLQLVGPLGKIYRRGVHRVHVLDFGGLTNEMTVELSDRMLMEHRDAQGQSLFTSRAWRWLFEVKGPLVHELIMEFFSTFRFGEAEMDSTGFGTYWAESARQIPDKRDLSAYERGVSFEGDFLGTTLSYTVIRDLMLRGMDVDSVNFLYLLARYLRIFASRRKLEAMIYEGQYIYDELDDTWAWVATGPERQLDVAAGASKVIERAPDVDEGAQAVPRPVQAPQPPPIAAPTRTMTKRMIKLEEEVHGMRKALGEQ
uniref:Uncharacterized protein n=1 Tax=Tanacetum cinerariifolium TaxID=118510 RepID=A0A6L2NGQ4_TANCI|nr:hypothetical protein [Tanacetum cinerariifolium]